MTAGLLLSQLFHLSGQHADDDGWFYHAAKYIMDETTLTRTELDTARKKLKERGIVEEALRGVPAQLHWRIDHDRLANLIAENPQTEVQKSRNQDRGKPAALPKQNRTEARNEEAPPRSLGEISAMLRRPGLGRR